jgi:hypothetical protein
MWTRSRTPGLPELAGHSAVGAGLGIFLSLTLVNTENIFEMIVNSASPRVMTLTFVGTITAILTVGSTLTGLIFSATEER